MSRLAAPAGDNSLALGGPAVGRVAAAHSSPAQLQAVEYWVVHSDFRLTSDCSSREDSFDDDGVEHCPKDRTKAAQNNADDGVRFSGQSWPLLDRA